MLADCHSLSAFARAPGLRANPWVRSACRFSGARVLEALCYRPQAYHLNEGHAAPLQRLARELGGVQILDRGKAHPADDPAKAK